MHDVVIIVIKGLAGGALVVAFALLSEGLSPKRFAGLFSAAPAVAIAGLTVVVIGETTHKAHENALGMIAGGFGMMAYAAAVVPLLRRKRASVAATLALFAWTAVAAVAAVPVMLG